MHRPPTIAETVVAVVALPVAAVLALAGMALVAVLLVLAAAVLVPAFVVLLAFALWEDRSTARRPAGDMRRVRESLYAN